MMYENFRHTHGSGAGSGPVANGPKKVGHSNSNGSVKSRENLTSKNQGMASSNTNNWEPDVQMLLSTPQWLKIHGLKRHKLDLGQILPSIGFRHSDDYVRPLKKPVRARYCKGLFTQVPYRDGTVFNLTTNKEKLQTIERQIKQAISLYKKRLEWLTTESRRVFGVIEERCVCIVVDVDASSDSQFDIFLHALIQVLKEQVVFLAKFNLIRASLNMECWQNEAVCVTLDSLEGALDWIWKLDRTSERSSTCTVEAVVKALSDQHVEAVYLFSEGDASVQAQELLRRKVQDSRVPLHVVSLNCTTPSTITFLKGICKTTKGRFHAFSVADEYEDAFDSFKKTMEKEGSDQPRGRGRGDGMPSVKLGVGLREDVITLWEELDEARNTLAEIQALQCEMKDPKSTPVSVMPPPGPNETRREGHRSKSELYMSSREWLKRHGLRSKKLGFYDLLQTLAFKHCDGVVDIQSAPSVNGGTDAIVRPKLVNARYCDKFAHVRWKDGNIMHVHVSGPIHRNFEQRMLSALDSYRQRMEWLQHGSRELFGTIIEDQAAILVDTSASMATRLFLVKDKLYRLMQEQLRHKVKFNLIKFDSRVQAWRDRMVDCNTHNLDNAWQWVKGLSTGGSTNTLAALKLALSDPQCQAIYLLTDGRPDQPPSSILAQVHLLNPVPMHTISFNCADTEANQFLCQLAAETGGRFHYFSEDGYDVDGPKPFESEDLRLLREEIDRGLADLKKVAMIRNECAQLDWYGSNAGRCSKNHPRSSSQPQRPMSASPGYAVPSPPSTKRQRPFSARSRAHSARARPGSARLTHSSYKEYLVSSASQEIEQSALAARRTPPQARETKTSLLRLNMMRNKSNEWILPETREYLARASQDYKKKSSTGKAKKKKTTKKKRQEDEDFSDLDIPVKKWLKKHGLVARKLTILDALAPTMVRHTAKYIPILDKHVLSKVFDQVLPLAHTSGSNREEVQLVNPQGVNLKAYESKLGSAIQEYTRHLDELVYVCLSDEERIKYPEDKLPSFLKNKESMMSDLEKQDWPLPEEDIVLLEKEIEQAQVFLRQSEELRKTSEEAAREIAQQQKKAREDAENKRIEQVMKKNDRKDSEPPAPLPGNKYRLRHHKVLARSEVDGFYYPGLVSRCLNSRYVEVDFNDFDRQVVPVRFVIPVEGARPCPTLKVGDYVLVKTLVPREDEDDVIEDTVHCYVPGIVQVVPLRKATATKCFTILRFNGNKITSLRADLVKISKARYTFACRYIRDALLSAYRSTSPYGFYPRSTREETNSREEDEEEDEENKEETPRSQASSRSSKSAGSNRTRSRSSSSERSPSPAQPGRKSPRSSSGERSPSPPRSGRSSRPSSAREKLEEWKNELEAKHLSQLKEIKDQLLAEQEKQRRQQEELEQKQRELREKQQELLQGQLDEQKSRARAIQDEQKRLQQQQEDLLNKQRDQQEQLLQHQFNQTQSLQLQHQQLLHQLANSGQPKRAVSSAVSSPSSSPRSSRRSSPSVSPGRSPKDSPRGSFKGSAVSPRGSSKGSAVSPKGSRKGSRPNSARSSKKSSKRSSRPSSIKADSERDKEDKDGKTSSDSDSDSPSVSSSSSSSSDEPQVTVDEVDGQVGVEPEPEEEDPPNLQFHLSGPGNEACLLTKGSHGLLISRLPPDQDPAVETRPVPKKVEVGEEVLARWSDDGWYYRGTVRKDCGDGSYFIEDSLGDLEQIYRPDIITDADDADNIISRGDAVVALHPSFPFSYAPGVAMDIEEENLFQVRHYDGMESLVPRDEVYLLPSEKFESDCRYILNCEQSLVGQAVVARNDEDGLFHLGKVRERVGNGRQYIIEWAEQSLQLQSYGYIFGAHTKRHPLVIGDRVLALVDPATYVYMPGWITGSNGRRLCIKFCNGKSSSQVDPLQCFRLSRDYYDRIVDHYNKKKKEKQ